MLTEPSWVLLLIQLTMTGNVIGVTPIYFYSYEACQKSAKTLTGGPVRAVCNPTGVPGEPK